MKASVKLATAAAWFVAAASGWAAGGVALLCGAAMAAGGAVLFCGAATCNFAQAQPASSDMQITIYGAHSGSLRSEVGAPPGDKLIKTFEMNATLGACLIGPMTFFYATGASILALAEGDDYPTGCYKGLTPSSPLQGMRKPE